VVVWSFKGERRRQRAWARRAAISRRGRGEPASSLTRAHPALRCGCFNPCRRRIPCARHPCPQTQNPKTPPDRYVSQSRRPARHVSSPALAPPPKMWPPPVSFGNVLRRRRPMRDQSGHLRAWRRGGAGCEIVGKSSHEAWHTHTEYCGVLSEQRGHKHGTARYDTTAKAPLGCWEAPGGKFSPAAGAAAR
jgi:hypothetical protein